MAISNEGGGSYRVRTSFRPKVHVAVRPERMSAPTTNLTRDRYDVMLNRAPPGSSQPAATGAPVPPPANVYTVAAGDSYWRVAQNQATAHLAQAGLAPGSAEYDRAWNRLTVALVNELKAGNGNRPLRPGDTLLLPDPSKHHPLPAPVEPTGVPEAPVPAGTVAAPVDPAAPPSVDLAAPTGAVDLGALTPRQKYDYFRQLVESQGGTWKTGEGEANIIGVRGFSGDQTVAGQGNVYDDTIYVVKMVGGEPVVEAYRASTDAGIHNPDNRTFGGDTDRGWGISHLDDGFYADSWTRGGVPGGGTGLRQSDDVQVNFDTNYDGVIQDEERDERTVSAGWGIQFHTGGSGDTVGTWSAGCQVIHASQWQAFQDSIGASAAAGQQTYSYLLIDSSKLPAPVSSQAPAHQPQME